MNKMTALICSFFMAVFVSCPAFSLDVSSYEQTLKEADSFFDQAQAIQKEKGEGGFLVARPYQKEYDEALSRYNRIMNELGNKALLRRQIAAGLDFFLSGYPQFTNDYVEELASTQLTILPQVLYRNASMTFDDITKGNNLFLPPLLVLPEKTASKYQAAISGIAPSALEAPSVSSAPVSDTFSGFSFSKDIFYKMLNSAEPQGGFINAKLAQINEQISKLGASDQNNAANLYDLGCFYLLQKFYMRLGDCLTYYQQARAMLPKLTYTPLYTEFVTFRANVSRIKRADPVPEDMDLKNMQDLKNKAKEVIEVCKVNLPPGFDDNYNYDPKDAYADSNINTKIRQNENAIKLEKSSAYNNFESLIAPIYYFNLFEVEGPVIETFKKAAAIDSGNATYHLTLANMYRLSGMRLISQHLLNSNSFNIGEDWAGHPSWSFKPRDENAAIDLSSAKNYFGLALSQYQAVGKLSADLGQRGMGLYYMSLLTLEPGLAKEALSSLSTLTGDLDLICLEYAYYLLDRSGREQQFLKFSVDTKNAFSLAAETFGRISPASPVKELGASILSEDTLCLVLTKMKGSAKTQATFDECVSLLSRAEGIDPDNPYPYLTQGYMLYRKGTTLSVMDTLSLVGETFSMAFKSIGMAGEILDESQRLMAQKAKEKGYSLADLKKDPNKYAEVEREVKKDLEAYAEMRSSQLEEEVKGSMGSGNEMIVKRYDPSQFLKAVDIYNSAIARNPALGLSYYYLGRTYTALGLYYSAVNDESGAKQYGPLAKDAFKRYLKLSMQ